MKFEDVQVGHTIYQVSLDGTFVVAFPVTEKTANAIRGTGWGYSINASDLGNWHALESDVWQEIAEEYKRQFEYFQDRNRFALSRYHRCLMLEAAEVSSQGSEALLTEPNAEADSSTKKGDA